jgi:surface antigen
MKHLDANTLVAYVDGELDTESAALVEKRLESDAEARRVVSTLCESAALVRAAHAQVLYETVPDRLVDLIEDAPESDDVSGEVVSSRLVDMILNAPDDDLREPARAPVNEAKAAVPAISLQRRRSIAAFATAAVFAAVMVGGGMMVQKYTTDIHQRNLTHQARAVSAMSDPWREAAFQEALETKKSQTAVVWENPDTGQSGAIIPVKTYRRDDGTFCRAFRTVDTGATSEQPNYGVACRRPGKNGRWVKTVEAISAPGPGGKLQF